MCLIWMHGLGEPGALCGCGTVARLDSKQEENWSRPAVRPASLTMPAQEILLLIAK